MDLFEDTLQQQKYSSAEPFFMVFDHIDPDWCLSEALKIRSKFPPTMEGSATGKFYGAYKTIHFLVDSELPLIKNFVKLVKANEERFKATFNRELRIDLIHLAITDDASEEMSIPHIDGYWMEGQAHLTILGNADVDIWAGSRDEKNRCRLTFPNGTVWYINSSVYYHTINTSRDERQNPGGLRIELTAPINIRDMEEIHEVAIDSPDRYIDPSNLKWQSMKRKQIQIQKEAYKAGRASAPKGVGYIRNVPKLDD